MFSIFYTLIAVLLTWPLVPDLTANYAAHIDPPFSAWRLARIAHQLENDPANLFDGGIFWPAQRTLAYSDAVILQGVLAVPWLQSRDDTDWRVEPVHAGRHGRVRVRGLRPRPPPDGTHGRGGAGGPRLRLLAVSGATTSCTSSCNGPSGCPWRCGPGTARSTEAASATACCAARSSCSSCCRASTTPSSSRSPAW